jgi:hypothetical protein
LNIPIFIQAMPSLQFLYEIYFLLNSKKKEKK